jgi:hypothetical protein
MRLPRARASAGVSRALRAPVISKAGTSIARSSSSVRMAGNFGSIRNPRLPAHMSVISSRSSMTGLSSHRARRRRSGIGVRVASPLIVNHHQKRASSLVSPAGSSSVMEATRPGARIAWFMAIQPP